MNPCAGTADLLVFEARPFSHLGIPPKNTALISSRVLLYTKMQDLGSGIFDFFNLQIYSSFGSQSTLK